MTEETKNPKDENTSADNNSGHVVWCNVEDEMRESYLRYSMSVIISRALPDVRDGLKPSQRRILYAMRQLNLGPNAKHRKCAKISGDTSGDYHPHGEQVIYPTLVRMAQPWSLRYRLVDGQGNFGSIDGDAPAAMRYTEARMTQSAMQLMEDLEKETVEMVPNYDDTKLEPSVFPAKFPNLLANGSSGIAVGMATNIPPHNVQEIIEATRLLLDNPTVSIDEIMKVLPGPDFPTGSYICGKSGINKAYHHGKGRLILRAKTHVEETASGKQVIVVDEIPYNVNKSRMVEQLADLINDKQITSIADLRDESDKDGIRVVIELKKGEMADITLNQLYKFTDLQVTFGANMLVLDKGLPRVMNIRQLLSAWVDHRIDVIRRRCRFELNKAEARAHILEGYLKALDHLDEVIKIIRGSDNKEEAKMELVARFAFTEKQAGAILDLRLYQLTGMEHDAISNEHQELLKKIAYLKAVLADENLVKDIIRKELEEIEKHHKSPRRSEIVAGEAVDMDDEDLINEETVVLTISNDDYVKRMSLDNFREQRRGGSGVIGMQMRKEEDMVKDLYIVSTHDHLLFFTNKGRCYWLRGWQIPDTGRRSKGKPIIQMLEGLSEGEKVATVLNVKSFDVPASILLCSQKGVVKKTLLSAFSNPRRNGINAILIDEGDEIISARLVSEDQQIMLFTRDGMAVRFNEENVRPMGRVTRGVRGVRLKDEQDCVVGCEVVNGDETILVACENGFGKRTNVEDYRLTSRGGVGVRSILTSERNGPVVGALSVLDNDSLLMMSSNGQTIRIGMDSLRVMGRATQGVKLANMKNGAKVVAMQKLDSCLANAEDEAQEPSSNGSSAPDDEGGNMEMQSVSDSNTPEPINT